MYGGDVLVALDVVNGLQDRLKVELKSVTDQQQKTVLVTELFQNIFLVANNLLKRKLPWLDLPAALRAAAGIQLISGLQKAAALMLNNLEDDQSRRFEQTSETVQASIRILNQGSGDVVFNSARNDGNSVKITFSLTADDKSVAVVVIFLFNDLDRILKTADFLSSHIFSVSQVSDHLPVELTFTHDRSSGADVPACVVWEAHSWVEGGCQLVTTNSSHSTCSCHNPGTVALISQLGAGAGDKLHDELGFVLGILLPVITGVFITLLLILLTLRMSWKTRVGKEGGGGGFHVFCVCKREGDEEEEGDYYPDLNSSPTSTTLSDGTTLQQDTRTPDTEQQKLDQNLYTKEVHPLSNKMIDQPTLFTSPHGDQPSVFKIYQGNQGTLFRATSADQEAAYLPPLYNIDQSQPIYRVLDQPSLYTADPTLYRTEPMSTVPHGGTIPVFSGSVVAQNPEDHYFRPVSPNGHIYMEIGKPQINTYLLLLSMRK